MGWMLEDSRFDSRKGQDIFFSYPKRLEGLRDSPILLFH